MQDVVRNWHTREPGIVQTMGDLVDNAKCSKKAFLEGIFFFFWCACVCYIAFVCFCRRLG